MTPQEQAYFQSLVDNMYGQFVHDVAVGRHSTDAKITPLATGQVWTGKQAQPLGLIDAQGGFRLALMETARSVGIEGEPRLVRPAKETARHIECAGRRRGWAVCESNTDVGSVAGLLFSLEVK